MSSYRKTKVLTIIVLVIAIVTLGVGFAAFSTTLNISSSATVSPSSDNFSIGFYANKSQSSNSTVTIFPSMSTDSSGSSIDIIGGSKTLSGLKARFLKPGDVVVYDVVIKNDGEYDAYLNSVNMSQNATCVAEDEATDSLVQSACEGIKIAFMLDGYDENVSGNVNIPIAVGECLDAQIIMRYREDSSYADGPFSVSFEPISLDFSTVSKEPEIISFKLSNMSFEALEGMTWREWIDSKYNVPKESCFSKVLYNDNIGIYVILNYDESPVDYSYGLILYSSNYDDVVSLDDVITSYNYILQ